MTVRYPRHTLRTTLIAALLALGAMTARAAADPSTTPVRAPVNPPAPAADAGASAGLTLERIEFEGNTRTDASVALDRLPLRPGDRLDGDALLAAAETLRESGLFRTVAVHARPGAERGSVVAVFRVEENRPRLRFGAGYDDFSGWYLIPAELDLDNLTGHGETLRLATRLGYRTAGVDLRLRSTPESLRRPAWELHLGGEGQDRVYFQDRTELKQRVNRGAIGLGIELPVGGLLTLGAGLDLETVEPDSHAVVYRDNKTDDREQGDTVPFDALPAGIRDDLGRVRQARLALFADLDAREGPGLRAHGFRARVSVAGVRPRWIDDAGGEEPERFAAASLDARVYAPLRSGLQLAARARAGAVTEAAPFYERPYLGGLYTVRGYPSQSLSPPEGDLALATVSLELRSAWVGPADDPRVVGILFADAGWSGDPRRASGRDIAGGLGWGIRVRVPWVRLVGLDVGFPISDAPVKDSFHLNIGLGWTF